MFERINRDAVEVFILGFSQGVATAARWVAHGTVHAEHLILWASLVPPEFQSREGFRRLRALQLTLVRGSRDAYLSNEHLDEQRSHLAAIATEPRVRSGRRG